MLSASYSNLSEDADVYMRSGDTEKYFYLYQAKWNQTNSGFSWNEGAGSAQRTYSENGNNPALDFIHRKEFSLSLRGSFFNKMISAELTYFNTKMDGFIPQKPTIYPSHLSVGLGTSTLKPILNTDVQNRRGVDFSITAQKQFGKVHAQLGVVGTYLTTEWSKKDELIDPTASHKYIAGQSLDALWGYKCVGFYSADDFDVVKTWDAKAGKYKYTYNLKNGVPKSGLGGTIMPGDLKYEDINGDGIINNKDLVVLGKSGNVVVFDEKGNPDNRGWGSIGTPWNIGVNLTLKYKNWTLFMLGDGQFGAYALKNNSYYYMLGSNKYSVNVRDHIQYTYDDEGVINGFVNPNAVHPRLTAANSQHNAAASTYWLYSTDRFNLRKVQLTYDFPADMFKGKVVKALSVYVNGNDLLTIAKNRKIMETAVGYAPQTRFYNIGAKVTF